MTLYRRTSATLFADVDQDVVALQADRGYCYGMEGVIAEVWKLLEQPADLNTLCNRLMEQFEVDRVTCEADVAELLQQMEAEQLIERVPG